jgi:hypothetical protein
MIADLEQQFAVGASSAAMPAPDAATPGGHIEQRRP